MECLRFHCCRTRICRKNYCIGIDFKHLLLRVFVCVRESNSSQPRRRRTAVVAKGSFLGAFCVFFNAFLIQFLANPSILFAAANWAVQQRSPRRQIAAELPHAELARIVRPFLLGASLACANFTAYNMQLNQKGILVSGFFDDDAKVLQVYI